HERGPGAVRQVRLPTYRNEFSSGVKPILALRPIPNGLRRRSTAITLRGAKSVKNLPTRITTEWRRCWDCESSPSRGPATDKRSTSQLKADCPRLRLEPQHRHLDNLSRCRHRQRVTCHR